MIEITKVELGLSIIPATAFAVLSDLLGGGLVLSIILFIFIYFIFTYTLYLENQVAKNADCISILEEKLRKSKKSKVK